MSHLYSSKFQQFKLSHLSSIKLTKISLIAEICKILQPTLRCNKPHIDEFSSFGKEIDRLKKENERKDKTISNLKNEARYYKELVCSIPLEQSYLAKNVNDYTSLKLLTKKPKNTLAKQFISKRSYLNEPISIAKYTSEVKRLAKAKEEDYKHELRSTDFTFTSSIYTQKRKERNYFLNKQHTGTLRPLLKGNLFAD